jgi:predicted DNA binding CopG/RHH family protein
MAITKKQKKELEALAALPDDQIDFSDIPEITDFSVGVRGLFSRPETKHISIRVNASDLVIANKLAAAKGLPYQTYIKSLLHEALAKENSNQRTVENWRTKTERGDHNRREKDRSK